MLYELSIKNLALIESLEITFGAGANILTGETGAGKSILVGAIALLMGQKAQADIVRAGCQEAKVEGLFILKHPERLENMFQVANMAPVEEIVVKRNIAANGRSRCYINGSLITLAQLKEIGETLLSISGQHDQQSLTKSAIQLDYLDQFSDSDELLENMKAAWAFREKALTAYKQLKSNFKENEAKRELYEFQQAEIQKIAPEPKEDEKLIEEKNKFKNSYKLNDLLNSVNQLLSEGNDNVLLSLDKVRNNLSKATHYDNALDKVCNDINDCYHILEDSAHFLRTFKTDDEFDEERIEFIDERLNDIARLKRKYGPTLDDVINFYNKITSILNSLDNANLELAQKKKELGMLESECFKFANKLHELRTKAAFLLADELKKTLIELGFPKIDVAIKVDTLGSEDEPHLGPKGYNQIEFLFAPNQGEGLKPLAKIASGGELSRFMLALKAIQKSHSDQSLVFDEIDTGLGGVTAEAVATKISSLAERQQLFIITHLPRMAAITGEHFLVSKISEDTQGRTTSTINVLSQDSRLIEISRMLGGSSHDIEALALAKKLLAAG